MERDNTHSSYYYAACFSLQHIIVMKKWKAKDYKPLDAFIPALLPEISGLVENKALKPDKLRVVLHQLYMARMIQLATHNEKGRYVFDAGWTPLNAEVLKRLIGMNYRRYIDLLIDRGIIYEKTDEKGNKSYLQNTRSSLYRINPQFLGQDKIQFRKERVVDYCTLKAIYSTREWFNRVRKPLGSRIEEIHCKLTDMLHHVEFNTVAATNYIDELLRNTHDKNVADYLTELPELFRAINEGQVQWTKVDVFGERLHTHLTGIKKEMRNFMRFRETPDEPLLCLDICNSQPYFASVSIRENVIEQLLPEFSACIGLVKGIEYREDYKLFAQLSADGLIYDYWQNVRNISRDEAKAEIIQKIMFGKNKTYSKPTQQAKNAFGLIFPSVSQLFYLIKRLDESSLPFIKEIYIKDNRVFAGRSALHKNLSCMMQRAESRTMLKRIAPKLIEAGITTFLTVHDSYLISPQHEQVVRKIVESEFRMFGVEPPKVKSTLLA